jgi:hypothetical protein
MPNRVTESITRKRPGKGRRLSCSCSARGRSMDGTLRFIELLEVVLSERIRAISRVTSPTHTRSSQLVRIETTAPRASNALTMVVVMVGAKAGNHICDAILARARDKSFDYKNASWARDGTLHLGIQRATKCWICPQSITKASCSAPCSAFAGMWTVQRTSSARWHMDRAASASSISTGSF